MAKILIKFLLFTIFFPAKDIYAQDKANCNFDKDKLTELVNYYRQNGCNCGTRYYPPVSAIKWNSKLETAAGKHADDMHDKKFFNHRGSDGNQGGYRLRKAGFNWSAWGENIGKGYNSETAVIEGWISSPGHCRNIMSADFKFMGVAKSGPYWVQIFAAEK